MGLALEAEPLLKKQSTVASGWVIAERFWVLILTSLMAFLQVGVVPCQQLSSPQLNPFRLFR